LHIKQIYLVSIRKLRTTQAIEATIAIDWPLQQAPALSAKDAIAPLLTNAAVF
jgi:dTDP-4-dehydrorhamnose 3,5-epimerase-like enzyme